ncbi:MAG: hypothetical protein E7369_01700 [Clostridiales bacterium]|nr:hypothetical protein [Clostridiales bacterium]
MKNRDIENKIKSSFSPAKKRVWERVESEVLSTPTVCEAVPEVGSSVHVTDKRGLIISVCGVFLALIIALCFIIPNFTKSTPLNFSGTFYIDINPSIQVSVDENGKTTEVIPLNQDALVLLSGQDKSEFNGKSGEDVAVMIWELAYKTGYISPTRQNNAVLITGSLEDQTLNTKFSQKVRQKLTDNIKNKGVYCLVITEKYNNSLEADAQNFGVSASKLQLILDAISHGATISESEYSTISVSEINKRVSAIGKRLENLGDDEYHTEIENIESYVDSLLDGLKMSVDSLEEICESSSFRELLHPTIERLDSIVDRIEDASEGGRDTRGLFLEIQGCLFGFEMFNNPAISEIVQTIKDNADEVLRQIDELHSKVETKKQEIHDKHNEHVNSALDEINSHFKPDNFDDDYEDWLEDMMDDYYNDWDAMKSEWQNQWQGPRS